MARRKNFNQAVSTHQGRSTWQAMRAEQRVWKSGKYKAINKTPRLTGFAHSTPVMVASYIGSAPGRGVIRAQHAIRRKVLN